MMQNGQGICNMKETNHNIGISSKFFSTIYNKVYYIISSLVLAVLLELITTVNISLSSTVIYWIAIIIYFIAMYVLYITCKIHRKKHQSLDVKKLSSKYIALRILIMLMYTMATTILISMIHVAIMVILLK